MLKSLRDAILYLLIADLALMMFSPFLPDGLSYWGVIIYFPLLMFFTVFDHYSEQEANVN